MSSPGKNSPQKSPLRGNANNRGGLPPNQAENRKSRTYQSSKTFFPQHDKNFEEGTNAGKRVLQKKGTVMIPNVPSEDVSPVQRKLELPELLEKYSLTTDTPFNGIRTTKARIEPIKPVEVVPKGICIVKPIEDLTNSSPSKKLKLMKTTSRLLPPDSKAITESKPSFEASARRTRDRDSQGTIEKESKQGSPSKNSFDFEGDFKEKQAFVTEALITQNIKKQPSHESFDIMHNNTGNANDTDMNQSIHSDEKQKDRMTKAYRENMKILEIEKQKYDPYAVLNQVKTKRQLQESTNRKIEQSKLEHKLSQRNIISDINKLSTPRDFTVLRSAKINLFEGIPYVPYDIFLRQDPNMQNVILKDILKILMDKAKSLQHLFRDNYRIDKIMKNIEEPEQGALNLHLEETIGLINAIGSLILQEFKDSIDKIGIKPSPIFDNPDLRITGFVNEVDRFYDNSTIFLETIDHLRDCIDCYHVMTRQRDRKPMADIDCSNLLQFIARSRYNLGQLFEAFRVIEKHVDGKLIWKAEAQQNESSINRSKAKGDNHKSLNELLQQKFNINKNKLLTTRESKVVLNQEAEDEKFLNVLQNQKQLKKKGAHELGDSRKLIILDRILNPLEDPEIQMAVKLAKENTNVHISKDLLKSIAGSRTKSVDPKMKPNVELPSINNTLQKILSNKNLTNMLHLDDPKKYTEAMESLTSRNRNSPTKEIVSNLLGGSKAHRHLGCLFEGEALAHSEGHENLQLPKIRRPTNKHATKTR